MEKDYTPVKMTATGSRKGLASLLLAVPALLFLSGTAAATGLLYSGSFYETEDEQGDFYSRQDHSVNLSLQQKITNFVFVNEYIRYSSNSDEQNSIKNERVVQGIDLVDDNFLFRTHLSAVLDSVINGDPNAPEVQKFEAAWTGKWEPDVVPKLTVILSQANESRGDGAAAVDSDAQGVNSTLDWERKALTLYYNYRWTKRDPSVGIGATNISHNAEMSFNQTYWENRIGLRLQQSYRLASSEQDVRSAGLYSLPVIISQVRTGFDNLPADTTETTIPNPALQNNVLVGEVSPYNLPSNSNFNNIVLDLNGSLVDRIDLYTETNLGVGMPTGIGWTAYSTSNLLAGWNVVALPPSAVTYNVGLQRFELAVNGLAVNYLKVVVDISLLGPTIDITEVQAVENVLFTDSTVSKSENADSQTSLGLSARLSDNISLSYRADLNLLEAKARSTYTRDELRQVVSLTYKATDQTFSSSFSFSDTNSKVSNGAETSETESKTYGLDFNKDFLPTLSAGCGVNKSETYESSELLFEIVSLRLDSTAKLYPDLDMTLQLSGAESNHVVTSTKNQSRTVNVGFVSRLRPGIILGLWENYSAQKSAAHASDSAQTAFTGNWQVSDALVFSGGGTYVPGGAGSEEQLGLNGKMNLALTPRVLLEVSYATQKSSETIEVGETSVTWSSRKGLRFEGGCRYSHAVEVEAKDFRAFAQVSFGFKVP